MEHLADRLKREPKKKGSLAFYNTRVSKILHQIVFMMVYPALKFKKHHCVPNEL